MKVVVLTKDGMDYTRTVTDFLHDFQRQTGRELEVVDPESPEGVTFSQTYDILEFPTLIALSNDGQVQNQWRGLPLPTISEVSYYA